MVKIIKEKYFGFIPEYEYVKYTVMGDFVEIMFMQNINRNFDTRKISKDEYIKLSTGEIYRYDHSKQRIENIDNIRRTLKYLKSLINTNFKGLANEKFFTITYKGNMRDTVMLKNDFEKFIKRLRYKYGNVDYLCIVEPQGRGAWHCHILLKFNDFVDTWIKSSDIEKMWGNGTARVKAIKKVDDLGSYLTAYLGDIEFSKDNLVYLRNKGVEIGNLEYRDVEIDGKKKSFIKGGRLHFYPTGMRIYRKSKGIREPDIFYDLYKNREKIIGNCEPKYRENIKIFDDLQRQINYIAYEQYNKKDFR